MKMSLGLVGRKIGMTRIFTDDGAAVPVTVLDVANNRVTQIKTPEIDGYAARQVTHRKRPARRCAVAVGGPRRRWRRPGRLAQGGVAHSRSDAHPSEGRHVPGALDAGR